jgi:hypothetical protein
MQTCKSICFLCEAETLLRHRQRANALAGRGEHRVRNHRQKLRQSKFA